MLAFHCQRRRVEGEGLAPGTRSLGLDFPQKPHNFILHFALFTSLFSTRIVSFFSPQKFFNHIFHFSPTYNIL